MRKIIALLLTLVMVSAVFAGCTKSGDTAATTTAAGGTTAAQTTAGSTTDSAYVKAKGKLVVGITEYAPMDYKDDDGKWTGFDAEFAKLFADKLGVEVEFIEIDWDYKFPELDAKSIDCIWNGMTITDEVKLNTSCSDAYVKNKQVVVMATDKIAQFTDAESMKSLKFACEAGSAGESAAKDAGFDVTAVQAQSDALMEVSSGSVDACVIDATMAEAMTGEGTSYGKLGAGISLTDEEYGVGFRKGSDLTAQFNEFRKEVKADGSLKALADKYNLVLAD